MIIKIKHFRNGSKTPEYQTAGSAGFDFCAAIEESVEIKPGKFHAFPTGVGVEIPKGYELQIRPRSGLAYKHSVTMLNGIGTIDSDYRGEMQVLLINFGDKSFTVEPGMRIAQGVVCRYEKVEFIEADELGETERKGGFGSTGLK